MARPLLATKLYVPKLRRALVTRPRLGDRLRRGAESRLTLVSAPAGFGKTTLLAEFLGEDRCVAWLSLDAADNEPGSFWTYVVTALRTAVPGFGPGVLELLDATPVPIEVVLTALVNDLAAVPHPVWLVLDDYHLVEHREVRDGMAFLLEHLPPHVHVVLSTRADPDLPLSRWRVRGELVEIRAADLRFTSGEVAAYLNEVAGLDLAAPDVAVLEQRTEGWIAALQLAALSIRGRDDVRGFIARFAGNDRYIVDYLVEEVLRKQPGPVRDFLLDSSVLDRLSGPLCGAVTGHEDAGGMLVTLERANLFLVPLDDRREWYRYHHLFADVLRARLLSERPGQVPVLHQRASGWYERHDLAEDAVRHALAAVDHDRAAHLMELAVPALRRHRQDAVLFGWLQALPDAVVRRSPVLSVSYGHMRLTFGDLAAVEPRLADAERALAAVPDGAAPPWSDSAELHTLPATIAVYRAALAQAHGDVPGTARHARRALDLAGPEDHLARGAAAGLLGLAAWAAGDVPVALQTFTQAVTSLHAAGNLTDERSGTVLLADMHLAAGRPGTARRLCEHMLRLAQEQGQPVPRATADLHVALSELDHEAGDLQGARRHLETAAAFGEHASTTEGRHRWFVAMARVADAEGDPEQAGALLDRAEQLYMRGFFPDVRPIPAVRARMWIARGDLAQAAGWARDRGLSAADEVTYLREFDHLTLVRLIVAQHRAGDGAGVIDQALGLLERVAAAAESSGRAGSLVEARVLQALAHDARGDRPHALEALGRAFAEAPEPDGYARLFLDCGAPMAELLRAAGDPGRRLLNLVAPADGPLSGRELQVLRLLDSELSGPQIARELFVSLNTLRAHTKHIFTKLDVTSRRAAVRRARERGLL
ncbi:LuxR C-terminal-related transcriptional regulator [Dactylosporangium sp. NPDC049525]|uniref:LuxR C-terminal-related transcriptional regulator n=1 Tax=Dactylosporangium sp. NPDC049525 TaxID=3154730 RepID=UPI0034269DB4